MEALLTRYSTARRNGATPAPAAREACVRVHLVTPAAAGSLTGNRVTVERWGRILRGLGHRVTIGRDWDGAPCDLLVALHARKSHAAIRRFHHLRPGAPLLVALGGTDLYRDLGRSAAARRSLQWATRIIVLQPLAARALPAALRGKVRVILQSCHPVRRPIRPPAGEFRACVLSHLRAIKDPLRPALASRLLPPASRLRIVHLGEALEPRMAERARREMQRNSRYVWKGGVPRRRALRILAGSHLLILPSRLEGGANAVSEALAAGVPILATRIPGSIGLLGRDDPGLFPVGGTRPLARLLWRCESEPRFETRLRRRCARLAPRFRPAAERDAWRGLLRELAVPRRGTGGSRRPPSVV
jgi:putative glycosyltransferase (TIGR04348 family)